MAKRIRKSPGLRLLSLALLLVWGLAACAGDTTTPDAPPTPTPTVQARQSPTALDPSPASATPGPAASAAATPLPPPAESPWPTFLRELDYGVPAGNSYGPRSLAVHPDLGRLYVRSHVRAPRSEDAGQVTVLDLASGEVLAIAQTGLDSYAEGELVLDIVRNRLYAVNADETTCTVLDAESLETVATLDGVEHLALDPESGRIYVAGLSRLRILDAQNYALVRETTVGYAPRFLALAADPGGGRLYAVYEQGGDLVLSLHDTETLEMQSSRPLPGRPTDLVTDTHLHRAYLTLDDGEDSLLWVVDGSGELVAEQRLGSWTQNTVLALDADQGLLFLGREEHQDNGVALVDTGTLQERADIRLEHAPNALAWDPASQQLIASQTYANQIAVLDTESAQLKVIYPTAVNLTDVAVDPELGTLYVTDTAGRLHVLDSLGKEELGILPGEGYIAVDSPHGRLYTGGGEAEQVRVFAVSTSTDPSLKEIGTIETRAKPVADAYHGGLYLVQNGIYLTDLETLTVTSPISDTLPEEGGFSPNPRAVDAVVDPGTGRILAIINNGVPGSNNGNYLYVYEPETLNRILTDAERSVAWVDVDPNTGQAYVGRQYMNLRATSLLVDGREYIARVDSLSGPLRVDPGLGRLYLSVGGDAQGHLLVLDAGTLDVLGAVPMPAGLTLQALDPERHLLYLRAGEGRLQVWSASGGDLPGPTGPEPAELPVEQVRQFTTGPQGRTLFAGSLYRSDDEGKTWAQIGSGLPDLGIAQVVASPGLAQDQTIYAVTSSTDASLGVWKSVDGGKTWRMANAGLSDMAVTNLAISPAFGRDSTLFATTRRQGLFRSTDGGQSWMPLIGRYYDPEAYVEPASDVVLSLTYAQDQTLFVAHGGLHRSTDGGDTWEQVFDEEPASLALSANLVDDGLVYAWFGSAGLLQSEDRGETWQPANDDLPLQGYGSGRVLLPGGDRGSSTVYFFWMPSAPEAPVQYFRSQDGAVTWERLATDLGPIIAPVQLDPQGTALLALRADGALVRWPIEDLDWQPAGLPSLSDVEVFRLVASPTYAEDRVLYAVTEGSGILRSQDAGLTWESTGFPLRIILGGPPELVVRPPDTLLVGTELGLYRWENGGPWRLSDGLPSGVDVTSPVVLTDGSLAVLAGAAGSQPRVYLSTDAGASWTQPLPPLPYPAILDDLFLSPAFASDHTAFLVGSREALRSVEGGAWEAFGPPGDLGLSGFDLSPAFDQDGLLFMRLTDNGLWRSTDRGETWTDVSGPWGDQAPLGVAPGPGYRLPAVTFSPGYRQDRVLLSRAGDVLYRSTDAGASWTSTLELGTLPARAVFAPTYDRDGTIYFLQGQSLWRSTDRGASWQSLPRAPWPESDAIQLQLSPPAARGATAIAWTIDRQLYRSPDNGRTWSKIDTGLVAGGIRQVFFAPDYAQSRLLFVVPFGGGVRKTVGDGPLLPVTESIPTSTATATPTIAPAPTATRPACPDGAGPFQAALEETGHRLGCAQEPAAQVQMAAQPFEHGHMIWDSSTLQIYVLYDSGRWQSYADTFVEGVDPAYDPDLPPPPRQPQRGFGKVWREQLRGPQAAIGWALENERAVAGWRQPFGEGLLLWIDSPGAGVGGSGTANLLYTDGTWQAVPAPAPQ